MLKWTEIKADKSNIICSLWYSTCIMRDGKPDQIQDMKFDRGLWWVRDGSYVYYSPTHAKL